MPESPGGFAAPIPCSEPGAVTSYTVRTEAVPIVPGPIGFRVPVGAVPMYP